MNTTIHEKLVDICNTLITSLQNHFLNIEIIFPYIIDYDNRFICFFFFV